MGSELLCRVVAPAVVTPYLRQDVLRNIAMLLGVECSVPPVPRTVWAAIDDGERVRGVMTIERFPGSALEHVSVLGESMACRALLRKLEQGREYTVGVQDDFQRDFVRVFPDARHQHEGVRLAMRPGMQVLSVPHVADVRKLSTADEPLVRAFDYGESPTLAQFLRWAQEDGQRSAVFGALLDGRMAGFVQFHRNPVGSCAEVGQIAVLPEFRGRGIAKQMLSIATAAVLSEGVLPYYTVDVRNTASLRTARAVGYSEICRYFVYCN